MPSSKPVSLKESSRSAWVHATRYVWKWASVCMATISTTRLRRSKPVWVVTKFAEGKNFTNRAELERQKKEGVSRKLCAFELVDKGIPRHGYEIADAEGNIIGVVTSGTMSPVLKKGIGMGYVKPEFAKAGTEICIKVRGRNLKAQVVKAPFRK